MRLPPPRRWPFGSLFSRSPKPSRRPGPTAKLWKPTFEPLEERSVPAIISSQLPNAGGGTSATGPPATISGFVFCDENDDGVFQPGQDHALAGVTIRLVRVGVGVVDVAQTSASGMYVFDNLRRGSYRIVEVQPPDVEQGEAILGTVNNEPRGRVLGPNRMALRMQAGENAVDYNFTEICPSEPGGGVSPGEEEPVPEPVEEDADCPIPDEDPWSFTVDGSVVNITGTSQGDVVRVIQSGSQLTISLSYLDENNVVQTESETWLDASAVTELNFFGQFGNDRLTIDNGGGLIGFNVNFDGGLGTDTLRLRNGTATDVTYTAGQEEDTGSVTLNGAGNVSQTINYWDIGLIADTVFADSLTIVSNNFQQPMEVLDGAVWAGAQTTRVTGVHRDKKQIICHHTGSATNPAVIIEVGRPAVAAHQKNHGDEVLGDEPPATPIEFANKTNVTLVAGNGSDFVLLNNPNTATLMKQMTIDGGNGRDVVYAQAEPINPDVKIFLENFEEEAGPAAPVE